MQPFSTEPWLLEKSNVYLLTEQKRQKLRMNIFDLYKFPFAKSSASSSNMNVPLCAPNCCQNMPGSQIGPLQTYALQFINCSSVSFIFFPRKSPSNWRLKTRVLFQKNHDVFWSLAAHRQGLVGLPNHLPNMKGCNSNPITPSMCSKGLGHFEGSKMVDSWWLEQKKRAPGWFGLYRGWNPTPLI